MSGSLIKYLKEKNVESLLKSLPIAAFVTDSEGRLKHFNTPIPRLLGSDPELDAVDWYGDLVLYRPDGDPMNSDENPVARFCDEENSGRKDREVVIAERPDGERLWLRISSSWLYNEKGKSWTPLICC